MNGCPPFEFSLLRYVRVLFVVIQRANDDRDNFFGRQGDALQDPSENFLRLRSRQEYLHQDIN